MLAVPNRPYRQDFRPFTIVQGDIVVGKESNRRSGESRNPELFVAGSLFSGGFPGFRLSPERRVYAGIDLGDGSTGSP